MKIISTRACELLHVNFVFKTFFDLNSNIGIDSYISGRKSDIVLYRQITLNACICICYKANNISAYSRLFQILHLFKKDQFYHAQKIKLPCKEEIKLVCM